MRFTRHFATKKTPQQRPVPGKGQTADSAGGFVFEVDEWKLLDRFLILGTEGGTYYITEQDLTVQQADNAVKLVKSQGEKVVDRVVQISRSGRAPKADPGLFVLALAAAYGDLETRRAAFAALPKVARTGTQLFQFVSEAEQLRGWGRAMRTAIGRWYNEAEPGDVAYQAMKYQQRGGWGHRDLLRLSHPKPVDEAHKVVYKWIVDGELVGPEPRLEAFERLKKATEAAEAAKLVREFDLPRECVPTQLLNSPEVWEALLEHMPMTAMVRNLGNMSKVGLLTVGSAASRVVVERLGDAKRIKAARVHPVALLMALKVYRQGHGMKGSGQWETVPAVTDALDAAFYTAFEAVEPTGKRFVLGIDVSGSMSWATVAGTPLTACEAATAMAMVTVATEGEVSPMAFADNFRKLPLSRRMSLADAMKHTQAQNFGGTDCALPMLWAAKNKVTADVFVVYTDNETWFGNIHPFQALQEYRQKAGIGAKLVVVGMCANRFTIADPTDPGMLDVVGFDTAVPQALREFALS